ncbi:hypothetical protein ABEG18_04180 [Alsobacter sp. KACC 23698]|uniref:Uncharacterized protein n=1 Tax=Alsobacter sp. KACC 23698 TaxID=3149229 RepID=A0AAU7JIU9_9HYPH
MGRILSPRRPLRGPGVAAAFAGLLLAGCSETGDFGRPKPTFWSETIAPLAGQGAATQRGEPVSPALLTDDEQELRSRAYRFLTPARERSVFDRQLADLAFRRIQPREVGLTAESAYYEALLASPDVSPRSRYQRLREDMESDRLLITPFAALACRVAAMDAVRAKALAAIPPGDVETRYAAGARIAENEALTAWVELGLQSRLRAYRFALDRLVVTSPDKDAIRAERVLEAFEGYRGMASRCAQTRGGIIVTPGGDAAGGARFLPRSNPRPVVVKP